MEKRYHTRLPHADREILICVMPTRQKLRGLGWEATRSIDKMCEDAWRWQTKNPNGYEG